MHLWRGWRSPLIGAYTLEGLALAVDPTSQRLVPANLIMYYVLAFPPPHQVLSPTPHRGEARAGESRAVVFPSARIGCNVMP